MGILQPLNIFLRQEIDRMQRVIGVVRSTLVDLKLAIEGTIIMSEVVIQQLHLMINYGRQDSSKCYYLQVNSLLVREIQWK